MADSFVRHLVLVEDARDALTLYTRMRTEELLHLQAAFVADRAAATKPETLVFAAGRLALIASVLEARGITQKETPAT